MVELEYIFDADLVASQCAHPDVLVDYAIIDLEMLVRLRVGDVEVFGQSEEGYQRWAEHLRQHHLALHVPSSAWALLSVLSIAVSVQGAFRRLRDDGQAVIDSLDCVIRLARQGDEVSVQVGHDGVRVGRAAYTKLYNVFTSFAERVRCAFLSVYPHLAEHVTLGPWFRGEADRPIDGTGTTLTVAPNGVGGIAVAVAVASGCGVFVDDGCGVSVAVGSPWL
jgi:hypothetical protein